MDFEGEDTLIVGLHFRCNSRCKFCFVETELRDAVDDLPQEAFDRVLAHNKANRKFRRLVLTGAEITLRPDLAELASAARRDGAFQTVCIQTNARRLADESYCRKLIQAGVTEYFVSIHAPTAELDRRLTQAPKGFAEMTAGVRNLVRLGARTISNTVVCRGNHRHLPDIASFTLGLGIRESQYWFFMELGDVGQSREQVRVGSAAPYLRRALGRLERGGASATVKWFPRCLLGPHAGLLNNYQPPLVIRQDFHERLAGESGTGCFYASDCRHFGKGCQGLLNRYQELFGDERQVLRPEGRAPLQKSLN